MCITPTQGCSFATPGSAASPSPASNSSVTSTGGGGSYAVAGIDPSILADISTQVAALSQALAGLQHVLAGSNGVVGGGPPNVTQAAPATSAIAAAAAVPTTLAVPASALASTSAEDSSDISTWVRGKTSGVDKTLLKKLAEVGKKFGQPVTIVSGKRSRAEQEALYQKYLNGTGNLAAQPGTSRHERGLAVDAQVHGVSLGRDAKAKQIALDVGLAFPVAGEPWHIEVAGSR